MDENNQIVPIAFGICKGEQVHVCHGRMSVLKECIGDNPSLLFISDRHAAIALAVQNEFPLAYHAAYTTEDFSRSMSHLQDIQPDAYDKLCQLGPQGVWSRAALPTKTYRAMVQEWYYKRRKVADNMTYEITDWAANKGDYIRQVWAYQTCTCQCRKWQLSGLPCGHVIAVTRYLGLTDCVQYVSDWFKKPKYQGTYAEPIHFIGNVQEWEFPQHIQKAIPPRMDNPQPGRTKIQTKNKIRVAGKIQLFVSHHQIDLSTVLIPNDGSLEEAFAEERRTKNYEKSRGNDSSNPENVRLTVLAKLQEALDEEDILSDQILTMMHCYADRFTNRRVVINNLMVLQDHPLVDYGKYALGCMTGADMKKFVYLKSFRDELLRSMEEKRQLMANYKDM
ncbi:transposase, MuDR, MULE transposase domain protein [Tanacetum coccineum]|uniref:Transposase, MuDR, MULE transposase domain protein n=1 Tax=Tanacetum coccineum TaxID=301880 RepID=A0ABQ5IYR3_9ASTR